MVQLQVISTDKLGYESESLTFKFNDLTMFRITNSSLNRGGKGLLLIDNKNQEIASCGREHKSFFRKACRTIRELGFQVSEEDISNATDKKYSENVEQHDSGLVLEFRTYKSRLKELELEKMKLQNKMKTIKNKIISKEKLA